MIELRQFVDERGRSPFERWYQNLEDSTRARVAVTLDRLRLGGVSAKGVGSGVLELRLDFGPGYRIYLGKDGERLIILLGGGSKKHHKPISNSRRDTGKTTSK